ncbi:hypothetical protein JJL56_01580 [Azospirillum sp. YIM DDC1]|uniref:ParA family protein n=1 Tax=Azospirillum aestuarii TaxID=2802052 RepID=A0ABS1HRV6_9PROT|nr:hypothetical protein [Azospirillum aestuarii]MBK4717553.1 hypothetical protein [Azospirillum aestuarii]
MLKVISFNKTKGGAGASTSAHLLANGFGLLDVDCWLFSTDQTREGESLVPPNASEGRPYAWLDGRDPKVLGPAIRRLASRPGVVIVDGAANRADIDSLIVPRADLVIVPTMHSEGDFRQLKADLSYLTNPAKIERVGDLAIQRSAWPSGVSEDAATAELQAYIPADLHGALLPPIPFRSAARRLDREAVPIDYRLSKLCQEQARAVIAFARWNLLALKSPSSAQPAKVDPKPKAKAKTSALVQADGRDENGYMNIPLPM